MKAIPHDLIALRAYEIWERNGCPHGMDQEHWEQAERELLDATPEVEATAAVKSAAEDGRGLAAGELARAADRESAGPMASPSVVLPPARGESARAR